MRNNVKKSDADGITFLFLQLNYFSSDSLLKVLIMLNKHHRTAKVLQQFFQLHSFKNINVI